MLNLNVRLILIIPPSNSSSNICSFQPAMRPSAAQLLQHERLEFMFNVAEMEKMSVPIFRFQVIVSQVQ